MIPSTSGTKLTKQFQRNYWKKVETTPPGLSKIFKTTPSYVNELIKKKHNTPATRASRFPSLEQTFNTTESELEKDKANLDTPVPELSTLSNGIKVTSEELYEVILLFEILRNHFHSFFSLTTFCVVNLIDLLCSNLF